jgi:hypothetical protein
MKDIEAVEVKVYTSTFLTITLHGHSNEFHTMAIFTLQRRVPIGDAYCYSMTFNTLLQMYLPFQNFPELSTASDIISKCPSRAVIYKSGHCEISICVTLKLFLIEI